MRQAMSSDRFSGFLNLVNLVFLIGFCCFLSYLITLRLASKDKAHHVYVISTVENSSQVERLSNLGNVLKNVDDVTWVVVEKSDVLSPEVGDILMKTNIPFEHLLGEFVVYSQENF